MSIADLLLADHHGVCKPAPNPRRWCLNGAPAAHIRDHRSPPRPRARMVRHPVPRCFANQCCCSTRPEVGPGGQARTASRHKRSKQASACTVSQPRTSSSRWRSNNGPRRRQRATCSRSNARSFGVTADCTPVGGAVPQEFRLGGRPAQPVPRPAAGRPRGLTTPPGPSGRSAAVPGRVRGPRGAARARARRTSR